MKLLDGLDKAEKELLLKFPVYISLLAANADGKLDKEEIKEGFDLTDTESYAAHPMLREYYKEVEKNFKSNILSIDEKLPKEKKEREEKIKKELAKLEAILPKLEAKNAVRLKNSLRLYVDHVANAHRTSIESFMIPFLIPGLTDSKS